MLLKCLHPHPIFGPSSVFYKRNIQCEFSPKLSHKHEKMATEISERIFKYHHLAQSSFPPTGRLEVPYGKIYRHKLRFTLFDFYTSSKIYCTGPFTALCEHGGSTDFIVSATGREFRELSYTEFVGSAPNEDTPYRVCLVRHLEECSPGFDYEV